MYSKQIARCDKALLVKNLRQSNCKRTIYKKQTFNFFSKNTNFREILNLRVFMRFSPFFRCWRFRRWTSQELGRSTDVCPDNDVNG